MLPFTARTRGSRSDGLGRRGHLRPLLMLVARTQTLDQRAAILSGLLWRIRLVGVLRIAVPAIGVAAFLVLLGQMWLTSIARQYGVSGIRIDRGQLVVETPQYSETGEDGSRYFVTAEAARTPLDNPNSIAMTSPDLLFERPGKAPFPAVADNATVATSTHLVTVPGITRVRSSDGQVGTLADVESDMKGKVTVAHGPNLPKPKPTWANVFLIFTDEVLQ